VGLKPCLCFCQFSKFETVFDTVKTQLMSRQSRVKVMDILMQGHHRAPHRIHFGLYFALAQSHVHRSACIRFKSSSTRSLDISAIRNVLADAP
jgi:hypothetical protein